MRGLAEPRELPRVHPAICDNNPVRHSKPKREAAGRRCSARLLPQCSGQHAPKLSRNRDPAFGRARSCHTIQREELGDRLCYAPLRGSGGHRHGLDAVEAACHRRDLDDSSGWHRTTRISRDSNRSSARGITADPELSDASGRQSRRYNAPTAHHPADSRR